MSNIIIIIKVEIFQVVLIVLRTQMSQYVLVCTVGGKEELRTEAEEM